MIVLLILKLGKTKAIPRDIYFLLVEELSKIDAAGFGCLILKASHPSTRSTSNMYMKPAPLPYLRKYPFFRFVYFILYAL